MDSVRPQDQVQTRLWNGVSGNAWVDLQDLIERTYAPIERLLIEAIDATPRSRVLDVGCGTGSTTFAAARAIGVAGVATGIDISAPMIAAARARAERELVTADFICANAQTHAFEPRSFDRIMSRFGVMFFDDPVRAFANLRSAATADATMTLIVWRGAGDNPFMTTAERAAASLLANIPPRQPGAPGQFAFADPHRVRGILQDSGWTAIDIRPVEIDCAFPQADLVRYFTRLGPLGTVLHEVDEPNRRRIVEAVRPAFDPFVHGAEVRFTAACWLVSARA